MRLRERRNRHQPLEPRAERELDAVDRALAGREVDPELADWSELTALLSEQRPEPAPGWTEELDRRVAAGFREDCHADAWSGLVARLGGMRPIKLLAPAGALAAAAVVVVVGVSSLDGGSDELLTSDGGTAQIESASEDAAGASGIRQQAQPAEAADADTASSIEIAPGEPSPDAVISPPSLGPPDSRIAPGTERRQVERGVLLTLSTRPEDVRETTDEAIAISRSAGGVVSSSEVSEAGRQATATLQLVIPTRNLDTTLDGLTELANVESLNESTLDITRPYVSSQDRLEDAEAERVELLQALGNADTAAAAEALRLQIDDARREISRAESRFDNIARRSRLSDVSLTIQGDPNAAAENADRTIGDWLDDTVSVLRDVAGILLVSGAILVPLGILMAIAWFVVFGVRRRRRERALDAHPRTGPASSV